MKVMRLTDRAINNKGDWTSQGFEGIYMEGESGLAKRDVWNDFLNA